MMAGVQKRKIQWVISLLLLMLYFYSLPTQAQYGGGTGEPNDPYQIATAEDLMLLGDSPEDYEKHFILIADIDLDPNLPGRKVFNKAVIAPDTNDATGEFEGTPFTGVFDGNGHTISNFGYVSVEGGHIGLFGNVGYAHRRGNPQIKDLGLIDPNINAGTGSYVGSFVGELRDGTITCCYTRGGSVSGNICVGGLVGWLDRGTITNCYSSGSVRGESYVGGLTGYNYRSSIINSYSTGSVSGNENIGGLVGDNLKGEITNSFWDKETSGQPISAGGTEKTTAEMQMVNTFIAWGCEPTVWTIDEGVDYPRLAWENKPGSPLPVLSEFLAGSGTQTDPYLIYTAEQMNAIGTEPNDWDKQFKLMADIDLSGFNYYSALIAPDTNPAISQFQGTPFTGVFNGNGYTISNLTIEGEWYLGLFGQLESVGGIMNLGVVDVNIISDSGRYIGGLVGSGFGTVLNCYSTGKVSGQRNIGGLVGFNSGDVTQCYSIGIFSGNSRVGGLVGLNYGDVTGCCSTGTVSGENNVGGLVGSNDGDMTHCYSTGLISGRSYVGGLMGSNGGSITTSYSTGRVAGNENVGGLVGYELYGSITMSFWDMETSGQATSVGGTGKTMAEMQDPNTFIEAGWDFVGRADGPNDFWAESPDGGYPILWWQLSPLPELPSFSGGSGTADDPYLISTAGELNSIGHNTRLMGAHFKLINDIDLAGVEFFIIGSQWYPYSGFFDGNGYKISNFSYTSMHTDYIGLFGYVSGKNAVIKDLGLIDANINAGTGNYVGSFVGELRDGTITGCYIEGGSVYGKFRVGGLVGYNMGSVTQCYSTCAVSGNRAVGGLVGYNEAERGEMVLNCYSTGAVSGDEDVGGLVGVNGNLRGGNLVLFQILRRYYNPTNEPIFPVDPNFPRDSFFRIDPNFTVDPNRRIIDPLDFTYIGYPSLIRNCYATGSVTGMKEVGGLVGDNDGRVTDSFWDIQTSGQTRSFGGAGKTTAEMQMKSTFLGWDRCGNEGVWTIDEGNDYPRLWWENKPGEVLEAQQLSDLLTGTGTQDDPYLIHTAEELNMIGVFPCELDKNFKLMSDIDLSHVGTEFNIIGITSPFTGVFDGNGKKITNLNHNKGLFVYVSGAIKDLGLIDANVDAGNYVGSLVGYLQGGTITNCYAEGGSVLGGSDVGGLVGANGLGGTITNCRSTGSVSGNYYVGGLVGNNWGTITDCYAEGDSVLGNNYVGGLVGRNYGTITNCYATGSVLASGPEWQPGVVGGLVGENTGEVMDSFWDMEASGQSRSAAGMGLSTVEMQTAGTFLDVGWDFVDESVNGTEDIWWILEGRDYPRLWWEAAEQ